MASYVAGYQSSKFPEISLIKTLYHLANTLKVKLLVLANDYVN